MKLAQVVIASLAFAGVTSLRATDFIKIINPNMVSGGRTMVSAIEGDYIVGSYDAPNDGGSFTCGFLYRISTGTFQDLAPLGATQSFGEGISGTTVVGSYVDASSNLDAGYRYDISTGIYTKIANPYGSNGVFDISAVSGSLYYGFYYNPLTENFTSFSTDGTSFAPLNYLSGPSNAVLGAYGSATVGDIMREPRSIPFFRTYGFFYNGSNTVTLNFPGAISTTANGTNGSLVVGSFTVDGAHQTGYIYNGSTGTYTDYSVPDAEGTYLTGITTNGLMIGNANTTMGSPSYGFLTTVPVPEPGTWALFGLGVGLGLVRRTVRRKRG